nr:TMV resistance protein N-like [Ipomoea trifida]
MGLCMFSTACHAERTEFVPFLYLSILLLLTREGLFGYCTKDSYILGDLKAHCPAVQDRTPDLTFRQEYQSSGSVDLPWGSGAVITNPAPIAVQHPQTVETPCAPLAIEGPTTATSVPLAIEGPATAQESRAQSQGRGQNNDHDLLAIVVVNHGCIKKLFPLSRSAHVRVLDLRNILVLFTLKEDCEKVLAANHVAIEGSVDHFAKWSLDWNASKHKMEVSKKGNAAAGVDMDEAGVIGAMMEVVTVMDEEPRALQGEREEEEAK